MSRDQHLSEAVELINAATLGWTQEDVVGKGGGEHTSGSNSALQLLHQVQELCLNRDASILSDIVPLVLPLQSNPSTPIRKFVLTFLRDVVKLYPQYAPTLSRTIVYLLNDAGESVRRQSVLAAVATFPGALRWLVHDSGVGENWQDIASMKNSVLNAVNDPSETVSSIAIKFAETVVLHYVPGKGVGPNAARDEDKSIHRELSYTHPFLRAVRLEQEGYALSSEMTQWLKLGRAGDGNIRFGPKHYNVLINALQNTATMKSSLYPSIAQAMTDVLERARSPDPPAPLHTIMGQLCSACLKLIKVAPSSPLPVVQRLLDVVASIAGGDKTRQAIAANVNIRGLIHAPQATVTPATKAETTPVNITDLICSKMGFFPPPPPGHPQQQRVQPGWGGVGKGQAAFAFLMDRIAMEGIGTRLATTEEQLSTSQIALSSTRKRGRAFTVTGGREGEEEEDGDELEDDEGGVVLQRQGREEGEDSADVTGTAVDTQEIKWFETSTEAGDVGSRAQVVAEAVSEAEGRNGIEEIDVSAPVDIPMDPLVARLSQAYKAFTRILVAQENVQAEGARLLHVKLSSKLAHLLAEAETTFEEEPKADMIEEDDGITAQKQTWQTRIMRRLTSYLLEDYIMRYSLACSVLNELYVADLPKNGIVASQGLLYERLLLAILSGLASHSTFQTYKGKKFFAATVIDAPRLPEACINLVCGMCDEAKEKDEVFAGIMTLRDVVLYRPATRSSCLEKLLSLTSHKDSNVRTTAVQAVANQLWVKTELRQRIEEYARESLQEVLTFEPPPVPSGEDAAAPANVENSKRQPSSTTGLTPEATRHKLSLYFALCIKSEDMFLGLFDAYAHAEEAVRSGITMEIRVLMRAMLDPKRYNTADAKGESMAHIMSLLSGIPKGAEPLLIEVLDLLVPIDENDPHPQLISAAKKLRVTRYGYIPGEVGEENDDLGLTAIVPVLRGLGHEAAHELLPSLLRKTVSDKPLVKRGLKRLIMPRDNGLFSPVEMLLLLHKLDFAAAKVPRKCLGEAVSLCLDDRSTYKYRVLREALDKLSTPNDNGQPLELPVIIMRTVLLALRSFPELKKYVASVLLPRLVQCQVWREPTVWQGFILCASRMGSGTGATSFKALCQLPAPQLRALLKEEKSLCEPLRAYALNTVINLDPAIKEVLGEL